MTIDSKYFPELKTVYDGVDYAFEHESIGGFTIKLVRLDAGVWSGIPSGNYAIELGGRDPIYRRGRIKFPEPITPEELVIERYTPRTQELLLNLGESFPSNAWEFAIDKITMICQELEGSKCDCPNDNVVNPCTPVYIVSPPADTEVAADSIVIFSVTVNGTLPFTYQWYEDDVLMGGEESATLTFTVVAGDDGKVYKVEASNACGMVDAEATLTIGTEGYKCDAYQQAILNAFGVPNHWPLDDLQSDPDWPPMITAAKGEDIQMHNNGAWVTPGTIRIMPDGCEGSFSTLFQTEAGPGGVRLNTDYWYPAEGGYWFSAVFIESNLRDYAHQMNWATDAGGGWGAQFYFDADDNGDIKIGLFHTGDAPQENTEVLVGQADGEPHVYTWYLDFIPDVGGNFTLWIDWVEVRNTNYLSTDSVDLDPTPGPKNDCYMMQTVNGKAQHMMTGPGKPDAGMVAALREGWLKNRTDYTP